MRQFLAIALITCSAILTSNAVPSTRVVPSLQSPHIAQHLANHLTAYGKSIEATARSWSWSESFNNTVTSAQRTAHRVRGRFLSRRRDDADNVGSAGITETELREARQLLHGYLTKQVPHPESMQLLGSGDLAHGGSWRVYCEEDVSTGIMQFLTEAHFSVPAEAMARCLLDERLQERFDKYLVTKEVLRPNRSARRDDRAHNLGWGRFVLKGGGVKLPLFLRKRPQNSISRKRGKQLQSGGQRLKTLEEIGRSGVGSELVYHEVKLPGPMRNRDYVYFRRAARIEGDLVYIQRDVPSDIAAALVSPRPGIVRAGNGLYWQQGLIRAVETDTSPSPEPSAPAPLSAVSATVLRDGGESSCGGGSGDGGTGSVKGGTVGIVDNDTSSAESMKSNGGGKAERVGGRNNAPATTAETTKMHGGKGQEGFEVEKCVVVVQSQDNFEGGVPVAVQNFAAAKGAPVFVKLLERAAFDLMAREKGQY